MSKQKIPMRIEKFGPWLRPALFSPWLAMTALNTVNVFVFGWHDPKFVGSVSNWAIAVLTGSIGTVLISLALIATDLLRAKFGRLPPVGIHAWAGGVLAFAITLGLYVLLTPLCDDSFLFYIMLPGSIAAGAISARLIVFQWTKTVQTRGDRL